MKYTSAVVPPAQPFTEPVLLLQNKQYGVFLLDGCNSSSSLNIVTMASKDDWETTDVLVCGCGPTGAMLSGYLGRMGAHNIVLEKEPDITTDPRGIALDDDGIRLLQGLGLYRHIFTDIGTCISRLRFVGGVHNDLHAKPFLCFDMASSEGNTGHVGVIGHKQPVLEKCLRSVVKESRFAQLRTSCTLTSIREDDNWVYATYVDKRGTERCIRSQYFVASDGKTGFTRKNYLEPKGVRLEWAEETRYEEVWVALNWKIHLATKESHPSFPLWKLGYSPEEVYDLFFPTDFRFLCNPSRPAVCGRFGLPEDRLWRFEFVIGPGEDGEEMAKQHMIKEVVVPYIRHPGSCYGLDKDVKYPEDCIETLRSRPFRFAARSCNKWALGRVILCGDSAHVFPPFGGQGIASGFRDAVALAWRLGILCSPSCRINHEPVLTAWYQERKQQLDKSLSSTVRNGSMVNTKSVIQGFLRNWALWCMQLVPSWKHYLEQGPRADGPIQYTHLPGMPFLPEMNGGLCFPQTYCTRLSGAGSVQLTDDVIFSEGKKGIFQIVVLLNGLEGLKSATDGIHGIEDTGFLFPGDATFFVPRMSVNTCANDHEQARVSPRLYRSASAEEFAQSDLCQFRPLPYGYNEELMWKTMAGKIYILLRPDRFVFAACSTKAELEQAAHRLVEMFS